MLWCVRHTPSRKFRFPSPCFIRSNPTHLKESDRVAWNRKRNKRVRCVESFIQSYLYSDLSLIVIALKFVTSTSYEWQEKKKMSKKVRRVRKRIFFGICRWNKFLRENWRGWWIVRLLFAHLENIPLSLQDYYSLVFDTLSQRFGKTRVGSCVYVQPACV